MPPVYCRIGIKSYRVLGCGVSLNVETNRNWTVSEMGASGRKHERLITTTACNVPVHLLCQLGSINAH